MAATVKQRIPYNAAAEELWRVAEIGDVDELEPIFLRGVDVDARNKHGMTALMRAAYHGHERMVRALLQHGADPNASRNDRFTALALAAFFGHTGTVRILIEHGAKREVITRCGASAQTWAMARTFEEAARYLATHKPAPAPAFPAPAPVSPAPAPVSHIRTLKEPPEIWDLVHEVPKGFNARSAFITRLKSMKGSFALRVAAVLVVSAACVVGVILRRGSQARNLPSQPSANQNVIGSDVSVPLSVEDTSSATAVTPPATEAPELAHHSEAPITNDKRFRKVTSLTRQTRPVVAPAEESVQIVESTEQPAAAPVMVATPKADQQRKPALSPQVISPTTNTPKGKVIQWP